MKIDVDKLVEHAQQPFERLDTVAMPLGYERAAFKRLIALARVGAAAVEEASAAKKMAISPSSDHDVQCAWEQARYASEYAATKYLTTHPEGGSRET